MIHCANCVHCRVFKQAPNDGGYAVTRVRCARERWKYRGGVLRTYLYHTVDRRTVESCPDYECAGDIEDTKDFIPELRRTLPDCSYDEYDNEEAPSCAAMRT